MPLTIPDNASPRMRELVASGQYEIQEIQKLPRLLIAGDTVLELGAGIGAVACAAWQICPGLHHYYLVDADANLLSYAKHNLSTIRVAGQCSYLNYALADKDGQVGFFKAPDFWANRIGNNDSDTPVRSFTMSSLLRQIPDPVSVVICDIEGAERFLLATGIPDSVRAMMIELHDSILGGPGMRRLFGQLTASGFAYDPWASAWSVTCWKR